MNPETTIKSWLLAVGSQYGINEAWDYRWADSDAREKEYFFEYRILGYTEGQTGVQDMSSRSGNTVSQSAWQEWNVRVQIDLHNSQDGMYELASCVAALKHNQALKELFRAQSVGFVGVEDPGITNETKYDDEIIKYHMRAIVHFTEKVSYNIDETNTYVEQVRITMDFGDETMSISAGHVTIDAGSTTLVCSGDAELVEG